MSGLSTSFTFPIDAASASNVVSAFENGEYSELEPYIEANCLQTTSRNNWVEYFAHRLVKEFECGDLSHLTVGFDAKIRTAQLFAKELGGGTLSAAIAGLRRITASMRSYPARCARALDGIYTEGEILEELQRFPSSLSLNEAITQFNLYRSYNEGDDFGTLTAFLYAHLSVLEFSREKGLSAIYLVCLY